MGMYNESNRVHLDLIIPEDTLRTLHLLAGLVRIHCPGVRNHFPKSVARLF